MQQPAVRTAILSLPYPPSVNTYWRRARNRTYISKKGQVFKQAVAEYVIENKVPKFGEAKVEVMIVLRPRSTNFMDIDNCCKAVLDSCQDAGVFDDDNQIWKLTVERGDPIKGGACVVVIAERSEPCQ